LKISFSYKAKLQCLLIATAIIITLINWHGGENAILRTGLAYFLVLVLVAITSSIIASYHSFFLGYKHKCENDIMFYVTMTILIFSAAYWYYGLNSRDAKEDVQQICKLLGEYDPDVDNSNAREKINDICIENEPQEPTDRDE